MMFTWQSMPARKYGKKYIEPEEDPGLAEITKECEQGTGEKEDEVSFPGSGLEGVSDGDPTESEDKDKGCLIFEKKKRPDHHGESSEREEDCASFFADVSKHEDRGADDVELEDDKEKWSSVILIVEIGKDGEHDGSYGVEPVFGRADRM